MRTTALALYLAFALVAGCGKSSDSSGGGTSSPPPAGGGSQQSNLPPIDPATTGSISGVVTLDGWVKPDAPPGVGQVPFCAACHPNGVKSDTLLLGDGQTMGNVLVYVNSTFNNRSFPAPTDAAFLDQVGCLYNPHVLAIRVNQPLNVKNSDSIPHNIHAQPQFNKEFNFSQSLKDEVDTVRFTIPELSISVKCDVHPWMKSWIHVMGHPFFALTKTDGAYKIEGLPAGEYEVRAWHEKFDKAPLIAMVNVKAKETVTLPFVFKGGEKPPAKK